MSITEWVLGGVFVVALFGGGLIPASRSVWRDPTNTLWMKIKLQAVFVLLGLPFVYMIWEALRELWWPSGG